MDDGQPDEVVLPAAPPDRRAPVAVSAGQCPAGPACACCLGVGGGGHRRDSHCRFPHPAQDRQCLMPYPANIPPCQARATLTQQSPAGSPPAGACCVQCGRVTARRFVRQGAVQPWCGGTLQP